MWETDVPCEGTNCGIMWKPERSNISCLNQVDLPFTHDHYVRDTGTLDKRHMQLRVLNRRRADALPVLV